MSSISFARFPTIPIPFQNISRESIFRTLSKHQKATQVGLAAIGLLSLYFGIRKPSMIATGMGVLSLGVSYKLSKIINKLFASSEILIQEVHTWHESLPNSDLSKDEALSRIKAFIENPIQTNLDLSDLSISSLPDIFDSPILDRLKSLRLSYTPITSLPENFNPPNLEWLYLCYTAISSLPTDFNPPNLKTLDLSHTPITTLPVGFSPPKLEKLDLSNTPITTFPVGFNPPNLEWLYLSYTAISSLPTDFNPPNLKALDLSYTPITTLPVGFSPPNLKKLYLSKTQITSLPAGFNPPNLEWLYLNRTPITSLPVGFNPPRLEELYLSYTAISSLPTDFNPPNLKVLLLKNNTAISSLPTDFNPPNLKWLNLSETLISSLPDNFNPPKLEELYLSDTPITTLPVVFNPPNLKMLDLARTQITSLPDSILDLPNWCTVHLTISNFSNAVQGQIQRATDQEGYTGPDFEYEIQDASVSTSDSLEKALTKVLKASEVDNQSPSQFNILTTETEKSKQDYMKTWLDRLCHTASAKSSGRKAFFRSIVGALHLAENDPEFRSLFHSVVKGATETCGDRVALSALHLDIQSQLSRIETTNPNEIYNFLVNTVYTMDFLEKRASEIISSLRLTDPLEVYLGLPVKLREEFNISINAKDMLYFACGGLTEEHLTQARSDLHQALQNQEKIVDFLIGQPKWIEALSHISGEALAQAKNQRDEDGVDPSIAIGALQTYEKILKQLSLQTLKERDIF